MVKLSGRGSSVRRRFYSIIPAFLFLFLILSIVMPLAQAAEVTVAWDPSPSEEVVGYKVHVGTSSRTYAETFDAQNQLQFTIPNLQSGTTYYLAATAYDANTNESGFSEEISYQVPAANSAPTASAGSISTYENSPVEGSLEASDADGDSLTYEITTPPTNGAVVLLNGNTFRYTPNLNTHGSDSFGFKASDGSVWSNEASVTVTVKAVNRPPVAVNDQAELSANTSASVAVLANDSDPDGDTLSIGSYTQGANGAVTLANGALSYVPKKDFTGTDSFSYVVSDGKGATASASVTVTVKSVNDAPVAENTTVSTSINVATGGQVKAVDPNGDELTYNRVDPPKYGTLTQFHADGRFTYTPNANFTGKDAFTFIATDGHLASNTATVTILASQPTTISFEAEAGSLTKPMTKYRTSNASGNAYIMVPRNKSNLTDPNQRGGVAEYVVDVPVSGDYRLWGRVIAENTASNSFYVSFDNAPFILWETALGATNWIWDQVRGPGESDAHTFTLAAGQHVLTIRQADSGCKLDRMVLTNDPFYAQETVYEDAAELSDYKWQAMDAGPAVARINPVHDVARQSHVIELDGNGTDNGFRLGGWEPWENTTQFTINWSMKFSEDFVVMVDVETTAGQRYLTYTPEKTNRRGRGETVQFGLGTDVHNGEWHTFVRDLQADLSKAQRRVQILKVNGFLVRGSGMIDDVKLWSPSVLDGTGVVTTANSRRINGR